MRKISNNENPSRSRLLILAQSVDEDDIFLGFFAGWLRALAPRFESVHVVCLREGAHDLPDNVSVHSLGKESGASRLKYLARFYRYIWTLRGEYDAVFVHMNQEYVLLGGVPWKLLGKRVYLWRNHQVGSYLTTIAAFFCTKVFCTSRFSYTARFRKTILMPLGIDTQLYRPVSGVERPPRSILFLARLMPSKRPDLLLEALGELAKRGVGFRASFYGSPLPRDTALVEKLKHRTRELGLEEKVAFSPGQPHAAGPAIMSAHEIFVNLAESGMYDKTIFEAAACGCIVLAASKDFAHEVGDERFTFAQDGRDLADKLEALLALAGAEREKAVHAFKNLADRNSLKTLTAQLAEEMK
jgi:glycosyltransferase involved in cell wall biosynthesis